MIGSYIRDERVNMMGSFIIERVLVIIFAVILVFERDILDF